MLGGMSTAKPGSRGVGELGKSCVVFFCRRNGARAGASSSGAMRRASFTSPIRKTVLRVFCSCIWPRGCFFGGDGGTGFGPRVLAQISAVGVFSRGCALPKPWVTLAGAADAGRSGFYRWDGGRTAGTGRLMPPSVSEPGSTGTGPWKVHWAVKLGGLCSVIFFSS
jgi:hypothetical protein